MGGRLWVCVSEGSCEKRDLKIDKSEQGRGEGATVGRGNLGNEHRDGRGKCPEKRTNMTKMIACTTASMVEIHLFHQCSNNVHLSQWTSPIYIQHLSQHSANMY